MIFALEARRVDQESRRRRLAGQRRDLHPRRCLSYSTGDGFAFDVSAAYSAIVRSLENFPEPATFRIAWRAGSPYSWQSRSVVQSSDG